MATALKTLNMNALYLDLMNLCSQDDAFFYKDIRLHAITYRIFNSRLCSFGRFKTQSAAVNCCGTMFSITNSKNILLVSLPLERLFDYEEGFGQAKYHERGRLGDKMEKLDGSLMSTFLHGRTPREQVLRLKSKQSITSNQVLEAMQLLVGEFKSELERLVRLNFTVNMEYTSPSNNTFVTYAQTKLTILSIRSHADGQTFFSNRLKNFLVENQFPTILNHLVPFESIAPHITHKQLLRNIYQESHGEGYVVEIIQPDLPPYLVKIKTQKYSTLQGDFGIIDSPRSLFEAIITEDLEYLTTLFKDDRETLKRINDMEQNIKPKYNHMIETIENFYQQQKHLSKKEFGRAIVANENMAIYLPLLMRLHAGEENDYKLFAIIHAKDLFGIPGIRNQVSTIEQHNEE